MKPVKYINREISWLSFNERVLQEAEDPRVPLLERLKFLGIYSNNLDEFFRDKVAALKRLARLEKKALITPNDFEILGENPVEVLNSITDVSRNQHHRFNKAYERILKELEKENIYIINETQLTKTQGSFVEIYFKEKVRSRIVPIMLEEEQAFPSLKDDFIYLAVRLLKKDLISGKKYNYALIEIPNNVARFLILPQHGEKKYVILLDDVIRHNLKSVFQIFDFDKIEAYTIKITRDAQLNLEDDLYQSLPTALQKSLKDRKKGDPSRFVFDADMPYKFQQFVLKSLKLRKTDAVIAGARYHNFKDFMSFPSLGRKDLLNPKISPLEHPHLVGRRSIIEVIKERDILLNFPYQSFNHVLDLLREASIDPKVKSIQATAYRVASDSNVMAALINAVKNGKAVTVVIELRASFDEASNISWLEKLQDEGVNVITGVKGLKVHSKLIQIEREVNAKKELIALVSTGNFNEKTAKIYGDSILITAHKGINQEIEQMFSFYRMNYLNFKYKHLLVAPYNLRSSILELIEGEILKAHLGKPCGIILKMNSMLDKKICNKLYKASGAGVPVKLIVRGVFALSPQVPGLSDKIEAISILDKFLEHARVFAFGAEGDEKVFMGSADLRPRNLDTRIEVVIPIYDKKIRKVLMKMLRIQLDDNQKARILDINQENAYHKNNKPILRSQDVIYEYFKQFTKKEKEKRRE
ncbi:UNVERIFIED_CONTAM: hypothetical protein GTU68_028927 [Idotea baltica]|nr:hypothetical protein [Idotea baltica]